MVHLFGIGAIVTGVRKPEPLGRNGRSPAEGPGPKTWGPWCGAGHKHVVHKWCPATSVWSIGGGIEQCRQAAEATGTQLRRLHTFPSAPKDQGPRVGKEDKAELEGGKGTRAHVKQGNAD